MKWVQALGLCFLSRNSSWRRDAPYSLLSSNYRTTMASKNSNNDRDGAAAETTACITHKHWEVEQKFALTAEGTIDLQQRLTRAGLVESQASRNGSTRMMVDWYFDVPSRHFPLIRQDCWLRHRSFTGDDCSGEWELKVGSKAESSSRPSSPSKATVYQEFQGRHALIQAQQLIEKFSNEDSEKNDLDKVAAESSSNSLYESFEIPQPPMDIPGLSPLARIGTQRSTWQSQSQNNNISVDLDTTDFGYCVGEVETVVSNEEDIPAALGNLQSWLQEVLGQSAAVGPPPMGKLEYYLSTQRPEILDILVDTGLMPKRS